MKPKGSVVAIVSSLLRFLLFPLTEVYTVSGNTKAKEPMVVNLESRNCLIVFLGTIEIREIPIFSSLYCPSVVAIRDPEQ